MTHDRRTVAVLGGGIAGLSAAHWLTRKGYQVTVFDARGRRADDLGGKARSYDRERDGAVEYGEHGFRFFPGFYSHVTATMADIGTGGGTPPEGTVADRLTPLPEAGFYARHDPDPDPGSRFAGFVEQLAGLVTVGGLAWLVLGCVLAEVGVSAAWWAAWAVAPIVLVAGQAILVALTAHDHHDLSVTLPTGPRLGRNRWQRRVLAAHPWARVPVAIATIAACRFLVPFHSWPLAAVLAAAVWFYPVLATVSYLWSVVGRIPLDVRPGVLESVVAFLRVTVIVTSSKRRLYTQWEHESWWSYIGAYRYSHAFRLAFATGLTRSFVATRAEAMSARTGGTILAQLLWDTSPTLRSRTEAADRVLDGPTHDVWIRPWVRQLRRDGVLFNEFVSADGTRTRHSEVQVTRLVPDDDALRLAGFEFVDRRTGHPMRAPQSFDHYVMGVAGTAAQRIVANSPGLVRRDRDVTGAARDPDPLGDLRAGGCVPRLDGILDLDFGWMTGIVYHLTEPVDLPHGHLLCLESEWALTAVEQRRIWTENGADVGPWKAIISVNVSDWSSPSRRALPARFEDLGTVARETWCQLQEHVPALKDIPCTPRYVADTAINDPQPVPLAAGLPLLLGPTTGAAALENLPLTNDEKLLLNRSGSWDKRPTARTVFGNLVIAGDYVRTATDFASMEAADEAARRAVNVILERDHAAAPPCEVRDELPLPGELRRAVACIRWIDVVATRLRLPHPLMVAATPIGWLAGGEVVLRSAVRKFRDTRRRRRGGA